MRSGDIGLRPAGPFSPVRDPLNFASCHTELCGDLVKAGPARSVTDSLFKGRRCARAPEGFAALVPFALALATPARTRSTIMLRSNSAKTPII